MKNGKTLYGVVLQKYKGEKTLHSSSGSTRHKNMQPQLERIVSADEFTEQCHFKS
jgi:hypothetical protein